MEVFDAISLAFEVSKETKAPCYVTKTIDGEHQVWDTSIGPETLDIVVGKTSFNDVLEDEWVFNFFGEAQNND